MEESSSQAARLMTQCEALQKEFTGTMKFCTYAGLCAGSVKAGKKLVSSLSKNTIEHVSTRDLQRKVGNQVQQSVANVKFPSTKGYYKGVTKYDELYVLNKKKKYSQMLKEMQLM